MSERGEMWVHGNSVMIQYPGGAAEEFTDRRRMQKVTDPTTGRTVPYSDLLGLRMGHHVIFRGQAGNTNWFHFSIPTPAVVPTPAVTPDLDRPGPHRGISIDRVSLYFATHSREIYISSMFLIDAAVAQPIRRSAPIPDRLANDHLDHQELDWNYFTVEPPLVLRPNTQPHGLLLAVEVTFDVEGDVTFRSAGIHYCVE